MRPVRLTMQAFGPYPGRVTIDFRNAVDAGLFGIYGQTGSGKSTIFSAMTFALFGAPAKPDQEAPSLRSDHADAGLATEVEFVFDIGTRRFVVVRRPEQTRPKQRGEGETRSAHEAFLFDASGVAVSEITDTQRGKIVAEKKVGKVDDAIAEMLGYGAEQFRQIVLLPQGRFETFLAAKTKERLDILRDLFDVSLYRHLATNLKIEADDAERHVRSERELCSRRLNAEGFESTDALATGIREAETRHAELIEVEAAARTQLETASSNLRDAETLAGQFKAADSTLAKLVELEASHAEIEALSARVAMAERARSLLDVESQVKMAADESLCAQEALKRAQQTVKAEADRATAAQDALATELARASEIEDLRRELDDFNRYRQTLKSAEGSQIALAKTEADERDAASVFNQAQKRLTELQNDRKIKADALKAGRAVEDQRRDISSGIERLTALRDAAKTFETATAALQSCKIETEKLSAAYNDAERRAKAARSTFEEAEQCLSASQALHLASKLTANEPCPVCGATEHPAPATRSISHVESDQAFREAKDAALNAEMALQEAVQKLAESEGVLKEREQRLVEIDRPEQSVAAFTVLVRNAESELNDLGPSIDITRTEAELDALDGHITSQEKERDSLRDAHAERQKATISARVRLEESLAAVPPHLRAAEAITASAIATSKKLAEREMAKSGAERAVEEARDAALSAKMKQEAAATQLATCTTRHTKAVEAFRSRLDQAALTEQDFYELKPSIKTIETDRAAIDAHHNALAIAKHAAEQTAEAVSQKVRPDLPAVEAKRAETEAQLNKAKDELSDARGRKEHLKKLRDELTDTLHKLDEAESASGTLRNLAGLLNGENAQKLDLETFAIGAMFDQVLRAANLRIGPMTNNRYRLERDLENGRGRRGLGIQVFDSHTGKARPTSTLSGGETFISALALALGLADVVESASGKIRLDTIFIDEGFGSLDTENGSGTLDQVLQVLGTLVSQNRAVGIISHVPLVQEAIPNGFYVRKNVTGSAVETRELT